MTAEPMTVTHAAYMRARPFVCTEESSPVLRGIALEPSGVVVATNRHAMIAIPAGCEHVTRRRIVAIRHTAGLVGPKVARLVLHPPTPPHITGIVHAVGDSGVVVHAESTWHDIEGPFPRWWTLFPPSVPAPGSAPLPILDPALLALFVTKDDDKRPTERRVPYLYPGASPEAYVVVRPSNPDEDWIGLVCPIRGTLPNDPVPAWARRPVAEP